MMGLKKAGDCFNMDLVSDTEELYSIWKHVGWYECLEQVDAHLESKGYSLFKREDAAEMVLRWADA